MVVGQLVLIESHQVQQRGVDVVQVSAPLHGAVAEFVRRANEIYL